MNLEQARERYLDLTEAKTDWQHCRITELFEIASLLVQAGDFDAKKRIYLEYIGAHPDSSSEDRFRVDVYREDLTRRGGFADTALQNLKKMEPNLEGCGFAARHDYFAALAECYIRVGKMTEASKIYARLVEQGRRENLQVDKFIYLLEGFVSSKLKAKQFDFEESLNEWLSLLTNPALSGVARNRALGHYFLYRGCFEAEHLGYDLACFCFRHAFHFCPSPREKVICAAEYLYRALRMTHAWGDVQPMMLYFKEHRHELLPADIQVWKESCDFANAHVP